MAEKKKDDARVWDHENDCWIEWKPKKEKGKDK